MPNKNSWAASAASRRAAAEKRFWCVVSELYGDSLTYDKFSYDGATARTTATCVVHGDFTTKPTYLVNGSGCPQCGRNKTKAAARERKIGFDGFVERARGVHGRSYEYPQQPYVSNKSKLTIICPEHGGFLQTPNSHLSGRGCPECANDAKRERNRAVMESLREEKLAALTQEFPEYDFSKAVYVGSAKKIKVVCPEHGAFYPTPNNMLVGNTGCPQCGAAKMRAAAKSRRLTTEEWVAKAKHIHGDVYDYSKTDYVKDKVKVVVTCPKHGDFFTSNDHIYQRNGCPRCSVHVSKAEDDLGRHLSALTTVVSRDRKVIAPKELDLYLPDVGLAVEYCGMYWHSHKDPEAEQRDKHKHHNKFMRCAEQGVRLITVYESEWKERPTTVKRLLRNAIGKGRGRVMARKCDLRKVPHADASKFFERYHIQGGAGAGEHYGLYWKGALVACMRFTNGANDRGRGSKSRMWTLARYATRVSVVGGASRLFRAFLREYQPSEVKSFSDNRYFSGGVYEKLGFVRDADLPPDYQVWSPKIGLRPKTHYQRKHLPARLKEHGTATAFDPDTDPRTETEMTYLMGARRLYDCGKVRWIWRSKNAVV